MTRACSEFSAGWPYAGPLTSPITVPFLHDATGAKQELSAREIHERSAGARVKSPPARDVAALQITDKYLHLEPCRRPAVENAPVKPAH